MSDKKMTSEEIVRAGGWPSSSNYWKELQDALKERDDLQKALEVAQKLCIKRVAKVTRERNAALKVIETVRFIRSHPNIAGPNQYLDNALAEFDKQGTE